MRYVKFKIETDEEFTGETGIVPNIHRQWVGYIPTTPDGLAHDLLEHSTHERGNFDEEMAAFGGMLFVRNFGAYRTVVFYSYAQVLAWDVVNAWRDNNTLRNAPKYRLTKAENVKIQSLLTEVRPLVIESYKSELEYELDEDEPSYFEDDTTWQRVCDWISYGFARAKRRFKGDGGTAYALFKSIARAFKREWESLKMFADSGREFTLMLDYDNGWAQLGEIWGD